MARKKGKHKKRKGSKLKTQLSNKILDIFRSNNNKSFNYKQVSRLMEIHDSPTRKLVNQVLDGLVKKELLEEVERGKYRYANQGELTIRGTVDATKRGGAFIVTTDIDKDAFVSPENLNRALDGDTVVVSLFRRGKRGRPEGEVIEIIDQHKREFVGTVEVTPKFAFLVPDNPKIDVDIYIPLEKLKKAKQGDKAIAMITDWPVTANKPFGKITELLGEPGEMDTEMHAILAEFGLPRRFPDEVEANAGRIPLAIPEEEIAKRRDFREITTFTIDPLTAKDFDDALSIQKLENGNWEVGVHIADVSHYVKEGSAIDKEALKRATSVYLVDRVVPMLPEVLSNMVCSLRPNEEKCVFSAVFELDDNAKVKSEWFGKAIINSDRRFTYEEAQEIIENGEGEFAEEILVLDRLAKKMRAVRKQKGAIEFHSSEVRFELDEKGKPLRVYEKVMKDANRLIEDFMLLANKKVAAFIGDVKNKKQQEQPKTFVYRIHDEPDPEKLETLSKFLRTFDYKINFHSDTQEQLNKMLKDFEGKNEKRMIQQLAIRSMAKAIYTTKNIGHYGLGFEFYSHFTSPIRRYPDLIAHRLLQHYLEGNPTVKEGPVEVMCKHSSIMEKKAADAERASTKYMQVVYMIDKVGEVYDGIVTGITEWGMYVELTDTRCEGMISSRDMGYDTYYFDERKYRLVGQSTGNTFTLGDPVTIIVKSADLSRKQLDFELVEDED